MTTHYGHINQTLLLTYINQIKPTHTIHKSSHNFHDGNHQGELLSSSHSSNHDVHACCVEVKCCPVANIFMETLCRGNGGMKFQIVLPQRLVAKKLENQPQTFIFRVPCYLHIYIYVYIYIDFGGCMPMYRNLWRNFRWRQHICWGDAQIEGFQLLDGKIQNVKQKHNICYMDIYDIIYIYIIYI